MQYGPVARFFAALGDAFTAIEFTSEMNLIHRDGLLSGRTSTTWLVTQVLDIY